MCPLALFQMIKCLPASVILVFGIAWLMFESSSHHECQMQDAILFYAIQSKAKDQNISLNPALTLLCDTGMSFVPEADDFFGMPSEHAATAT